MIGQTKLLTEYKQVIKENKFPRFSILVGPDPETKEDVAVEVAKLLNVTAFIILEDCKVDTIRGMIAESYKLRNKTLFIIPDSDNMSVSAKNAMLKVVEEPPNHVYFMLLVENEDNLLATIKSRAYKFYMQPYTKQELLSYYHTCEKGEYHDDLISFCDTPFEIKKLVEAGTVEFNEYVKLVVNNIAEVSDSNAFKITSRLAIKDGDVGYDVKLFFKAFINECFKRIFPGEIKVYGSWISITSSCLKDLRIKGINKQALLDYWILSIRESWVKYNG